MGNEPDDQMSLVTAEELDTSVYWTDRNGLPAIGVDRMWPGAQALIQAVDRDDSRPVRISLWRGANTLAQALLRVRTREDRLRLRSLFQN